MFTVKESTICKIYLKLQNYLGECAWILPSELHLYRVKTSYLRGLRCIRNTSMGICTTIFVCRNWQMCFVQAPKPSPKNSNWKQASQFGIPWGRPYTLVFVGHIGKGRRISTWRVYLFLSFICSYPLVGFASGAICLEPNQLFLSGKQSLIRQKEFPILRTIVLLYLLVRHLYL